MHCRVPLLPWPLPGVVGLLAIGRLQPWLWGEPGDLLGAAVSTDQCLALPHPGALDHVVPTRIPDYLIQIFYMSDKNI